MFQEALIYSFLYERRKKIDNFLYGNDSTFNNGICNQIIELFDYLSLKDLALDSRIEQTECNINLIIDGNLKGFTNEEIDNAQKLSERLEIVKEHFSDDEKERSERIKSLKELCSEGSKKAENNLNYTSHFCLNFKRKLQFFLSNDEKDFLNRFKRYEFFNYNIELPLAKITLRRWQSQLTNPNDYQAGSKFKFLVHAINTNNEFALENAKSKPIISTSLITDVFQGTYKDSKFGFVYQPTLDNVLLIGSTDCYADSIPFCGSIPDPNFFSLTSIPLTVNEYLNFTKHDACKSMHIEEIEKESMEKQNYVNRDSANHKKYNEIVLKNDSKTNPIAVFLMDSKAPKKSELCQAKELSAKLNLPLIKI